MVKITMQGRFFLCNLTLCNMHKKEGVFSKILCNLTNGVGGGLFLSLAGGPYHTRYFLLGQLHYFSREAYYFPEIFYNQRNGVVY